MRDSDREKLLKAKQAQQPCGAATALFQNAQERLGMGFLVHKDVQVKDIQPRGSRLMLMTLSTIPTTSIINVHTPTAEATEDKKDLFYVELIEENRCIDTILILLGDFNARVYILEGPATASVFGRYFLLTRR